MKLFSDNAIKQLMGMCVSISYPNNEFNRLKKELKKYERNLEHKAYVVSYDVVEDWSNCPDFIQCWRNIAKIEDNMYVHEFYYLALGAKRRSKIKFITEFDIRMIDEEFRDEYLQKNGL